VRRYRAHMKMMEGIGDQLHSNGEALALFHTEPERPGIPTRAERRGFNSTSSLNLLNKVLHKAPGGKRPSWLDTSPCVCIL
jgi:hypothetical protein